MEYAGKINGVDVYIGSDGRAYRRRTIRKGELPSWWLFFVVFGGITSPFWFIIPLILHLKGAF